MKKIILSTIAAAALVSAPAAVNSPSTDGFLSRGKAMYADANYIGCIDQLSHIDRGLLTPAEAEDVDWLLACACYHVQGASAQSHFAAFLLKYPASLRRCEAMLYIGDCMMSRSYAEALKQYDLIDERALPGQLREDLVYRKAFCRLKLADYDKAETLFRSLSGTKAYGNAANFYLAYIAYAQNDYSRARRLFANVNTATEPGCMADYYLAQIYYSEADYSKALSTVRKLLRRSNVASEYQAEANRIAGECLYRLDQPSEAIPYLKKYVAASEQPALSALYILGLSQYRDGDYASAIASLQPVSQSDDAMGQSALLYIGQALLNTGETDAALLSLDKALKMSHDKAVQESAFYNYAVARYRGGRIPFGSSVGTFEEFLRLYPDSRYAPEVQEYVVSGWLNDNNYEMALQSINRMKNPGVKVLGAKQKVLYVLGSRALATGNPEAALAYLDQSRQLDSHDKATSLQNALLMGEAFYRIGEYGKAVQQFDRYLAGVTASDANYSVGRYDRGYAHFAQKNYSRAADDFAYVADRKGLPAEVRADALNRLADTYYYAKDFDRASETYSRAYEALPQAGDYPKFQQAVMKGMTRDFAAKKKLLTEFLQAYPQSTLCSEAMLELAETEHSLGNREATAAAYRRVIETYPATAQARTAYLRLGSLQLQGGARDQAVATFKQLVAVAPTSDEASLAADYLKRIGAEDGTLADVRDYLAGIDNAPQIDVAEADRISFVTAEEAYSDRGDTARLEAYVRDYPDGAFVAQALGYLLDSSRESGATRKPSTTHAP
ncbi:MAG: tetratricopeptide repeat protein [Muribaculaceae bacterium]|nr:tetratricopeptide repeat protein [Muribaculaceae bacterium]